MARKKIKTYEIETITQLLNVVNEDNFTEFMVDFSEFIGIYLQIIRVHVRNGGKKEDIKFKHFTWKDDGKVGVTKIHITDSNTGELIEITPDRKKNRAKLNELLNDSNTNDSM